MSTRPASANRARRTPRGSATATTDARSGWRRAHRAYPGTVRTCPDDDHRNRCYISNPSPQAGPITSGYRIGNRCHTSSAPARLASSASRKPPMGPGVRSPWTHTGQRDAIGHSCVVKSGVTSSQYSSAGQ